MTDSVPQQPVPPVDPAIGADPDDLTLGAEPDDRTVVRPRRTAAPVAEPVAAEPVAAPVAAPLAQQPPVAVPAAVAQPAPVAQPARVAQPAPAAAPYAAPAPLVPGAPKGLAVAALITGVLGLIMSLFGVGFLVAVAAIVLGHLAAKRQRHAKAFWLIGLITGYLGLAASLVYAVIWANYFLHLFGIIS